MPRRLPVSDSELEVLKVLWAEGPATVRDVAAALRRQRRRLAYNTVLTLLSRLRDKGYVAANRREQAHLFRAAVSRDALLGSSLAQLADRVCDGTASPLVLALVKGQRFSAEEIAEFRQMLDRLEEQTHATASGGRGGGEAPHETASERREASAPERSGAMGPPRATASGGRGGGEAAPPADASERRDASAPERSGAEGSPRATRLDGVQGTPPEINGQTGVKS